MTKVTPKKCTTILRLKTISSQPFWSLVESSSLCLQVMEFAEQFFRGFITKASPSSWSPKHHHHHSILFQLLHSPHYPCLLIPDVLVGFREVNLFHYSLQWIAWFSFLVPKNAFEMEKMGKDLKQHFKKSQSFQSFCTFIVLVFQI